MERIVDKAVVLVCACIALALVPVDEATVVALLATVVASACVELSKAPVRRAVLVCFAVLAVFVAPVRLFLPLIVYDLACDEQPFMRALWAPAALVGLVQPTPALLVVLFGCGLAFLLARRTARAEAARVYDRRLRDDLREASLALQTKNADLLERQDLEVRLATLGERGRIAREIHDNVGHLLTRSIMQVEALQVVHREDPQVAGELAAVGATLHEAMDTVRSSVHDLHDDAFDLETQLRAVAEATSTLSVEVDYHVDTVPQNVGTSFVAVVREALSNTARHSDADHVTVAVVEHPGFYRLTVHDNGSQDPSRAAAAGHAGTGQSAAGEDDLQRGIGLTTMEDRARALGGVFRTEYDCGFTVLVSVPKHAAGQEAV